MLLLTAIVMLAVVFNAGRSLVNDVPIQNQKKQPETPAIKTEKAGVPARTYAPPFPIDNGMQRMVPGRKQNTTTYMSGASQARPAGKRAF